MNLIPFLALAAFQFSLSAFAAPLSLPMLTSLVGITHESGCPGTIPVCPEGEPCPVVTCYPYSNIEFKIAVNPDASCRLTERDFEITAKDQVDEQEFSVHQTGEQCSVEPSATRFTEQTIVIKTERLDHTKPIRLKNLIRAKHGALPQ